MAGDDVPNKKPDPSIYRIAAQRLKLDPAECFVIEDSTIGLKVTSLTVETSYDRSVLKRVTVLNSLQVSRRNLGSCRSGKGHALSRQLGNWYCFPDPASDLEYPIIYTGGQWMLLLPPRPIAERP
jgi:hypothetical protein